MFQVFSSTVSAHGQLIKLSGGYYRLTQGVGPGPVSADPTVENLQTRVGTNGRRSSNQPERQVSLEGMIRAWQREAPYQTHKPYSRRRNHYSHFTQMSGQDQDYSEDQPEQ